MQNRMLPRSIATITHSDSRPALPGAQNIVRCVLDKGLMWMGMGLRQPTGHQTLSCGRALLLCPRGMRDLLSRSGPISSSARLFPMASALVVRAVKGGAGRVADVAFGIQTLARGARIYSMTGEKSLAYCTCTYSTPPYFLTVTGHDVKYISQLFGAITLELAQANTAKCWFAL
ncbi:hypothetical protein RJ55_02814 [Drechmeria coniospora]|nr:hypothetical protein RJ55_02814 [Drechmeria coniospora]